MIGSKRMIFEKKQIKKLINKLKVLEKPYSTLMFEQIEDLSVIVYDTKEHLRNPPQKVNWKPISKGQTWGGKFQNMWLKTSFCVPERFVGRKIILNSSIDAFECMVYVDNKPIGLFNKDGDVHGGNHSIALLSKSANANERFDISLECYAGTPLLNFHPYDNYGLDDMPEEEYIRTFNGVTACAIREDVVQFLFDLKTLNQLIANLDKDSYRYGEVLSAAFDVYKVVTQYPVDVEEEVWRSAMNKANAVMKEVLSQKNGNSVGSIGLIGHAHLDSAWLWTVEETKRKCARTFSNALSLMDWYPEYTFLQSSALHAAWMKEYYPSIYQDMKRRIAEGRYEPNGTVWVECDCNITGGESMIRQFLFGQRFTMKEFGYKSDTFWLPDTFGYNSAIPQIMQGFGVKYFLTTKMSWNESNKFPYTTFKWKGMDGTSVLVHLNRMDTWPDVESLNNNYKEISDKHVNKSKLISYGYGDGGGGPQYQMLEMSKRVADVDGCPKAKHTTVTKFMNEIEKTQDSLPVWNGELYLELHRGTLTSMHDIKRSNRKAEIALREYEALSVLSYVNDNDLGDKSILRNWWETILLNQFHDILPGTCIPEVYDVAIPQNYKLIDEVSDASKKIVKQFCAEEMGVTIFNSLNWDRTTQVSLDIDGYIKDAKNQRYVDVDGNERLSAALKMPAMSTVSFEIQDIDSSNESAFIYNDDTLLTPFAKIEFGKDGSIKSFVDKKSGRELKNENGANLNTFYVAEDVPMIWDNWDIDPDIIMKLKSDMRLRSRKVVSDGGLQFRIESEYDIADKSTLTQHMVFYSDTPRVDFETKVDWKEKHRLLRVGFDINILSESLRSEIQFGHINRPTHNNTSWDAAKSELCNHRWSDLSENRFGVAILNDCKYGISCKESNIMLSLIKSGCRPDPRGDEGIHRFTYSFLPHDGAFSTQSVIRPAYELNTQPTYCIGKSAVEMSLFEIDTPNIIVESIKPSEDGGGYIIRLYECECSRVCSCKIKFKSKPNEVYIANMLEEIESQVKLDKNEIDISFKPFEIKTLLVK